MDGKTWTYTYNADGMRTKRVSGNTSYTYYYNGDMLRYLDYDSDTTDSNQAAKLYFVLDASGNPIEVSYRPEGSTTTKFYYYVQNLQGDVIALVDSANGNTVVTYTYDAWGNVLSTNGSLATTLGVQNPFRYRGYVYDSETKLYYLQSRYYNPEMGRFINGDAFASTGQGLLGNNMFAYCGNNPVNYADPTGTLWRLIIPMIIPLIFSGCDDDSGEPYSGQANCYAYAMRLENNPTTGKPFRSAPNPGLFSDDPLESYELFGDPFYKETILIDKIASDAENLEYYFAEVENGSHVPADGNWLIAAAIDPLNGGYHFFRKDSTGTWSHKMGVGPIYTVDMDGNPIYDPQNRSLDRYEHFVGYFEVGPNKGA